MNRGPVHTLQQVITPEMVAAVQHEFEIEDKVRKASHCHNHRGQDTEPVGISIQKSNRTAVDTECIEM